MENIYRIGKYLQNQALMTVFQAGMCQTSKAKIFKKQPLRVSFCWFCWFCFGFYYYYYFLTKTVKTLKTGRNLPHLLICVEKMSILLTSQ